MNEPAREGEELFREIAPRYDLLNRVLSLGIDSLWRRRVARELGAPRGRVLDVATGTGDLLFEIEARGGDPPPSLLVGVDPVEEMIDRARAKARKPLKGRSRIRFVIARAEALPFRGGAFAGATVGFGLRNFGDRAKGWREIRRVLGIGARFVVLDFSVPPEGAFRKVYLGYFTKILPRIGGFLTRSRRAYEYLPESVLGWPEPGALSGEAETAGFVPRRLELLTGGIAFLLSLARS